MLGNENVETVLSSTLLPIVTTSDATSEAIFRRQIECMERLNKSNPPETGRQPKLYKLYCNHNNEVDVFILSPITLIYIH